MVETVLLQAVLDPRVARLHVRAEPGLVIAARCTQVTGRVHWFAIITCCTKRGKNFQGFSRKVLKIGKLRTISDIESKQVCSNGNGPFVYQHLIQ